MGKMQFRKSKKIGPVRLTASKSGIGVSAGAGPVRVSKGADGKVRRTVRAPGTGLYQTDVVGGAKQPALKPDYAPRDADPTSEPDATPQRAARYTSAQREPMIVKGYLGRVTFDGTAVTVAKTARGSATVSLDDLEDVVLVPAGPGLRGVWFATPGESPGKTYDAVANNPRALPFWKKHLAEFEALVEAVQGQRAIDEHAPDSQASPAPPPPPAVPAGWYPAPDGTAVQRYWDGARWTEHTAPLPPGS